MPFEWKHGPDFAEVAEALGVATKDVLAMIPGDYVLYTPGDGATMIWSAMLMRDDDGILRVMSKNPHPGMLEKFRKEVLGE